MNYKIRYLRVIACCLQLCTAYAQSKTVFIPRSVTTNSTFELALTQYDRYHTMGDNAWHVYIKPLISVSTKDQFADYFLPRKKCCITLDEAGNGDVNPLWFNLIAPQGSLYTSKVCLQPKRKSYGAMMSVWKDFCEHWWFSLCTSFLTVHHTLGVCESNRTADGTCPGFKNACDGFNNPAWCAQKLPCCTQKRSGVDDIQLKVGYDGIACQDAGRYAALYLVGTIPTGNKQCTRALFEPLVGSRHASLGVGFNGTFDLADCYSDNITALLVDLKYRYVVRACQSRSFDLCRNGDWSRYLLVVRENELLNSQPGINLLTLPSMVTPRSTLDLWIALHIQRCAWHLEFGYDFWWRAQEKVCPRCRIQPGFGIQTLALCNQPINSASTATISQTVNGPNPTITDATFTPILMQDLNLRSGAQPSSISNTLYANIAYSASCNTYDLLFGLGASYEGATRNMLKQWSIWYTQGISF